MAQFYGVWIGRVPGVYDNWDDCKNQTFKFQGAQYRKLVATNLLDAKKEYALGYTPSTGGIQSDEKPTGPVLTVDGAYNGKHCEFQAVWHPTGALAFESGVIQGGTNNIAEFLGLVMAIKHLKDKSLPIIIYSDSVTALTWYRNRKVNTTAASSGKASDALLQSLQKAEEFLARNEPLLKQAQILKWHTHIWGEIPADFGRKK